MSKKPTHEDALQASRNVMKTALTRIAFYPPLTKEDVVRIAQAALEQESRAYKRGVLLAED